MKKNKWIILLMIIIMSLNLTIAFANTGKPIEVNAENPERIVDFEIEAPVVPEPIPEPVPEPTPEPPKEPTPQPVPQPEPTNTSNNRTERPEIIQNPIMPLGAVRGYLKTDKGEAIPNARIELHSKPTSTFTDNKGYFEFNNVPIGNHKLYLADENYSSELVLLKSLVVKENNQLRAEFTGDQIINLVKSNGLLETTQLDITETELEKEVEMIVSLKVKGTIIVRYLLNGELLEQEELKDLEMGEHLVKAKDFEEYRLISEREKEVILTEDTPDRTIIVEFELEKVENVPEKFPIWPFILGGLFIAILAVVLRKHIIIYAIEDANGQETLRRINKKKVKFSKESVTVDLDKEINLANGSPLKVVFLKNISRRIGGKEIIFLNKEREIYSTVAPVQINKEFIVNIDSSTINI